ncbi:LysR family transcriptional regulator substrate-binding protein [Bacillus xiapuensis]
MLAYIRDILILNDRMKQEVAAINGLEVGVVRIGTFTSGTTQWLPHILKQFQDDHSGIEVKLFEGDYTTLEQWISNGVIDCGFLTLPTPESLEYFSKLKGENHINLMIFPLLLSSFFFYPFRFCFI